MGEDKTKIKNIKELAKTLVRLEVASAKRQNSYTVCLELHFPIVIVILLVMIIVILKLILIVMIIVILK